MTEKAGSGGQVVAASPGDGSRLQRLASWYDLRRSGRTVVQVWLGTRLLMLGLVALFERIITGDVFYYWRKIATLPDVGLAGTLVEYPTPVVWILALPYGLSGGFRVGYLVAFVVLMLLLDAGFGWALWRVEDRRHRRAIDFWLLFVFLLGPLCYFRFDLLTAVLAGGALLAARRHPSLAGGLLGLGAAVKLWPALLMPAFLAGRLSRGRLTAGFLGIGVGLAAVSLLAGGWTRLVSPLTWQSGRGLQIESIWATPLLLARAAKPEQWSVTMSPFQAYEIFGVGVAGWLALSTVAGVLGWAAIAAGWVRAFRGSPISLPAIGLLVLATVAILVVTNKTLSPQYLLWLAGPMAALLTVDGSPVERRQTTRLAVQLVALALLTHLVYPGFYSGLLGERGQPLLIVATLLTAVRNVALLAFTLELCLLGWRLMSRPAPEYETPASQFGASP